MSNDLEEIKIIVAIHFGALGFLNPSENEQILKDRDKVLNALQRLEAIDNAKPSEALECLNDIYRNGVFISEISFTKQHPTNISPETNKSISEQCDTIKQALIKAQEQEKVLEILKPLCEVVETPVKKFRYLKMNGVVVYTFKNEEEFELLKRYCNEQDN